MGVHPSTPYCPAWKADEAFQTGLKLAEECAADIIESEAFRRAVHGIEKPTGWYKGKPGGYVREYSDVLTIFLMKGLRPEKYRDRVEMRRALAHIDISYLPDHLLQRVADRRAHHVGAGQCRGAGRGGRRGRAEVVGVRAGSGASGRLELRARRRS